MTRRTMTALPTLLTLSFLCHAGTSLASNWLEDSDDQVAPPRAKAVTPKKRAEAPLPKPGFNLVDDSEETVPQKKAKKAHLDEDLMDLPTDQDEDKDDKPQAKASKKRKAVPAKKVRFSLIDDPEEEKISVPSTKKKAKPAEQLDEIEDIEEESSMEEESSSDLEEDQDAKPSKRSQSKRTANKYTPGMYEKLAQVPLERIDSNGVEEALAEYGMEMDDEARDLLIAAIMQKKSGLAKLMDRWAQADNDDEYYDVGEVSGQDVLGTGAAEKQNDYNDWLSKIEHIKGNPEAYKKALELAKDLSIEDPSNEAAAIKKRILTIMSELPWDRVDEVHIDLTEAQKILDQDHFGLKEPKERIIEFLGVQKRHPEQKGKFICFVGPPGIGKTTLSESIAKATGRKFVSVALGGVHDVADIRGSLPVYISSYVGRILDGLRIAGTSNPVMLLDEIEKMGQESSQGNPAHALLEVLDPAQNYKFKDNFLGVPYDLSKILFICSVNSLDQIPTPLLDRLEVIELSSYTYMEKLQIARHHLRSKVMKEAGVRPNELGIDSTVLTRIIHEYTDEAGVRELKRKLEKIARKVVTANELRKAQGLAPTQVIMKPDMLETYLGPPTETPDKLQPIDTIGHIQGMAKVNTGGVLTPIEVALSSGKGEIAKTGQLGDVLKESVDSALTVVKRILPEYGMTEEDIANKAFHIHLSDASTKKEGPSAGAGITAAILSAVTKIPIKRDVSITGEINLLGQIKVIGGLKEKLIAAYKAGIKTAIIPKENAPELVEVPEEVRSALAIHPVSDIREVLKLALIQAPKMEQQAAPEPTSKKKEATRRSTRTKKETKKN